MAEDLSPILRATSPILIPRMKNLLDLKFASTRTVDRRRPTEWLALPSRRDASVISVVRLYPCVSAQFSVTPHLLLGQNRHRRKVIGQMRVPQLRLRRSDRPGRRRERDRRDRAGGEQPVELGLLADQPFADRYGRGLHGSVQGVDGATLLHRQSQFVRKLQHVYRAWKSIQFRRKRKSH